MSRRINPPPKGQRFTKKDAEYCKYFLIWFGPAMSYILLVIGLGGFNWVFFWLFIISYILTIILHYLDKF